MASRLFILAVVDHLEDRMDSFEKLVFAFGEGLDFELPEQWAYAGASPTEVHKYILDELEKTNVRRTAASAIRFAFIAALIGPRKAMDGLGEKRKKYQKVQKRFTRSCEEHIQSEQIKSMLKSVPNSSHNAVLRAIPEVSGKPHSTSCGKIQAWCCSFAAG